MTVTAQTDTKVYNRSVSSSVAPIVTGIFSPDVVGTAPTQTYDTWNVGTGKTMTATDLVINDGFGGNDYTISYVTNTTGVITTKAVTVTAQPDTKIYDRSVSSSVSPVVTGIISPDYASTSPHQTYDTWNVGTSKTMTASVLIIYDGFGGNNYTISYVTNTNGVITPLGITGNFTVNATKVYDGNTSAVILTETLNGVISPDNVSLSGGVANYSDKNVGVNKTVTLTGYSLTGAQYTNYTLTSVATTTANITVRTLTLSNFAADSKFYDGTTVATGIGFNDNRVPGDNLAFTRDASFSTPNVGMNIPVYYTNIVISGGSDMNNYVLASTTGTAFANIYARALILTATDVNKPFGTVLNGSTGYTGFTSSGLQNNETVGSVTVAYGTGSQASDPVGNYPGSVVISAVTGGTFNPANYSVTYISGAINVVNGSTVSGTITYYNTANTHMNNVTVELWQNGSKVYPASGTVITDNSGNYTFGSILPGTYFVHMTTVKTTAGSINSGDAAQANQWSNSQNNGLWPAIQLVKFFSGDVSGDNTIQPNDASLILAYFVNSWTTWTGHGPNPRPDWTFWIPATTTVNSSSAGLYPQITVAVNTPLTQNFYGMVTGDFNQSFVPGGAKSSNDYLTLDHGQTVTPDANGTVELPVYAVSSLEVGAVSLILDFPSDKLEIEGITMNSNTSTPLKYNVIGDELRIGWNSMTPVNLQAGDKLLTLTVKLTGALSKDETLRFDLASNPLNELDDADAMPVNNAVLSMNIVGSTLGVSTLGNKDLLLANYPNPFDVTTTIAYTLPKAGEVTLEIRDMMGTVVQTMVNNEVQAAGDYKLKLDNVSLPSGIYMATLKLNSNGQVMSRIIKLVCTR